MKTIIVIIILALGLLLMWLSIPAPAQARCDTVEIVKLQITGIFPQAKVSEIGGTEMTAFMFGFNALVPATAIIADYGLILQDPTRPNVAVVLFTYGCFSATIFLSRKDFDNLMRTL